MHSANIAMAKQSLHKRYGKTLSVCWPLWKDGGMQIDAETARMLKRETGMVAMETDRGIQALYHGWTSGNPQVLVASGVTDRIRAFLHETGHGKGQSHNIKKAVSIRRQKKQTSSGKLMKRY